MTPRLFYNTNGFAHHRLDDACRILADLGYDGVSLTPDVHHLDPARSTPGEIEALRRLLDDLGLAVTLESGARFTLDPRRKHWPSLLSTPGFERRQDDYCRHLDLCVALRSPLLSIWSGRAEEDTPPWDQALERLAERLKPVLEHASRCGVQLTFEPEPGMLIERVDQWEDLRRRLGGLDLGLTVDTGHLVAVESRPEAEILRRYASEIRLVQLDDAPRGVHEHLFFGDGVVDFSSVFGSVVVRSGTVPVSVELSRHSHDAVNTARRSLDFIRSMGD